MPDPKTILIVDDSSHNLEMMKDVLDGEHYNLLFSMSGSAALRMAVEHLPDLILLDIMLPGMDGFEVCTALKKTKETKEIPVIFMTALSDPASKVKGFSCGGVDYVTKPFQREEVIARIDVHLRLHILQQRLESEISAKDKAIDDLDAYARTVAHDLRNPLHTILGPAEMLYKAPAMAEAKRQELLELIVNSAHSMNAMISELLLLASIRQEQVYNVPVDTASCIQTALDRLRSEQTKRKATIELPKQWPTALGYAPWLIEVWVNLISNALKFGGNPPSIRLGYGENISGKSIRFFVEDNGPGVPENCRHLLFRPFTRLNRAIEGSGLGLSIVARIIEKLEGSVTYETTSQGKTRFSFTLPAAGPHKFQPPVD